MAAAKRQTLPKGFAALAAAGDLEACTAVFTGCELDARAGFGEPTALMLRECPEALTRWLAAAGADLAATNRWGRTALHEQAGHLRGAANVRALLGLGADVHALDKNRKTPLHSAAKWLRPEAAAALLAAGADLEAADDLGRTPLQLALDACDNATIPSCLELARALLAAGARRTPAMAARVREVGKQLEFHRAGFAAEAIAATSAAMEALYALFEVAPVARLVRHDGHAPITVQATTWKKAHAELWDALVPPSGAAATAQGEAIRISGKVMREILDNGGINWDDAYRAFARSLGALTRLGAPLPDADAAERDALVAAISPRSTREELYRLAELVVAWVRLNPSPIAHVAPAGQRR